MKLLLFNVIATILQYSDERQFLTFYSVVQGLLKPG